MPRYGTSAAQAFRVEDEQQGPLNSIKPFPFQEREYQSTRAIAAAFNCHWNDAAAGIQTGRLEKWLATGRERLVMAESVIILRETWAGGGSKMGADELISRICTLLDIVGQLLARACQSPSMASAGFSLKLI